MDIESSRTNTSKTWFNSLLVSFNPLRFDSSLGLKLVIFAIVVVFLNGRLNQAEQVESESVSFINAPKINDIYFLDFRLLSNALRPHEKYRLAKLVDITGDIVTLQYGNFFYVRQKSLKDSIRFGQLRYRKYFESKRYDFTVKQIEDMWQSGAIYLVKRPVLDQLFGNYVSPDKEHISTDLYIPGKRENLSASSFLKSDYIEDNLSQAFELFHQSAQLGFAKGQVNLAQMYLNGQHIDKDLQQALFWFKQAALQSHKPGILKYVIVCEQVAACDLADFYQSLISAGVNIKVRSMDVNLSPLK